MAAWSEDGAIGGARRYAAASGLRWPSTPAPYAAAAAVAAVVAGLVTRRDVVAVLGLTWDATVTLIALMILSGVLAEAGVFRWAAWRAVRLCRGSTRAVFVAAVLLSALTSALFTNDGTVLILTPVVAEVCATLRLPRGAAIAILMANGLIADVASTPLVSSNLVNILVVDDFRITLAQYARAVELPALAAVVCAAVALWLLYRRHLVPVTDAGPESRVETDRSLAAVGLVALAASGVALVLNATRPFPPAAVLAPAAAACWVAAALRLGRRRAWTVARGAPWDIVVFAAALNLLILGASRWGIGQVVWDHLHAWAALRTSRIMTFGTLTGLTAAGVNNLPSTLFWLVAMHPPATLPAAGLGTDLQHLAAGRVGRLILALVAGSDIGAKLTPWGSLATLMWLRELRRRGFAVGAWAYVRTAWVVVPAALIAFLVLVALGR